MVRCPGVLELGHEEQPVGSVLEGACGQAIVLQLPGEAERFVEKRTGFVKATQQTQRVAVLGECLHVIAPGLFKATVEFEGFLDRVERCCVTPLVPEHASQTE